MKFDFVIGNPPYQEDTIGDNKGFAPPVYNKFLDAAYQVADKVEMIHPARFLFNAGSTPKAWNEKCLMMNILKCYIMKMMQAKFSQILILRAVLLFHIMIINVILEQLKCLQSILN